MYIYETDSMYINMCTRIRIYVYIHVYFDI